MERMCEAYRSMIERWRPDAQPVDAPDRLPAGSRQPANGR